MPWNLSQICRVSIGQPLLLQKLQVKHSKIERLGWLTSAYWRIDFLTAAVQHQKAAAFFLQIF
jgi:hypothetical protein